MKNAFLILSAPEMFGFMRGQPSRLRQIGYKATVVSSESASLDVEAAREGAERITVQICRDIRPIKDLVTFARLWWCLGRAKPEAVILSGPKAIFLAGLAAWLAGIPCRIVVYHGMRQEMLSGPKRWLLDACDRVSFACATDILAVSPSLRSLVAGRGLADVSRVHVAGGGSANGIDVDYFFASPDVLSQTSRLRDELGIGEEEPVIGFVGRITEDKGIFDLYECFKGLLASGPSARLLLVGPNEMSTASGRELLRELLQDRRVIMVGRVQDVRPYYLLLSALVFPSLREGLGMAIAEAGAMGVPTVAYDVTGVRDIIQSGRTGLLVPRGDVRALMHAAQAYIMDKNLRTSHGIASREKIHREFDPGRIWEFYERTLSGGVGP